MMIKAITYRAWQGGIGYAPIAVKVDNRYRLYYPNLDPEHRVEILSRLDFHRGDKTHQVYSRLFKKGFFSLRQISGMEIMKKLNEG